VFYFQIWSDWALHFWGELTNRYYQHSILCFRAGKFFWTSNERANWGNKDRWHMDSARRGYGPYYSSFNAKTVTNVSYTLRIYEEWREVARVRIRFEYLWLLHAELFEIKRFLKKNGLTLWMSLKIEFGRESPLYLSKYVKIRPKNF
jgi:hypothetical protein